MEENIAIDQQFYCQNSPISYLHRQFNNRYINSLIINVYFRWYIFQGWIVLQMHWDVMQLHKGALGRYAVKYHVIYHIDRLRHAP